MTTAAAAYLLSSSGRSTRPAPLMQPSWLPYDADDPLHGAVARTPSPAAYALLQQQVTNPRTLYLGDLGGVTLPQPLPDDLIAASGGNSTPATEQPSFLSCFYPSTWIDTSLTAHAVRGYNAYHWDRWNWERAGLSAVQAVSRLAYIQSWGFRTSFWGLSTSDDHAYDGWADAQSVLQPILDALNAAGASVCENTILIIGGELDRYLEQAGLLDIAAHVGPQCQALGIQTGIHLTSSRYYMGESDSVDALWQGLMASGVTTLFYQADGTQSAGEQAAVLYYARQTLARNSPDLQLVVFEVETDQEFYGNDNEQAGQRRCFELFSAPGVCAPVGMGSGAILPDGSPIYEPFLSRWLEANK